MKGLCKLVKTALLSGAIACSGMLYAHGQETNKNILQQELRFYDKEGNEKESLLEKEVKISEREIGDKNLEYRPFTPSTYPRASVDYNSPTEDPEDTIFNLNLGFGIGFGGGTVNVKKFPKEYQNVPVHEDDYYVDSKTKELKLEGKSEGVGDVYLEANMGIPIRVLNFIRIGYRLNVPLVMSSGDTEQSLENSESVEVREDYERGADAGTYARASIPVPINTFYLSADIKLHSDHRNFFLLRTGISQDSTSTKIDSGWERWGYDESYLSEEVPLSGRNYFFGVGFGEKNGDDSILSVEAMYHNIELEGKSDMGKVVLENKMFTIGTRFYF